MSSPSDVTNPGSVNAGSESFGLDPIAPNQPVRTGPSTNPGPTVSGLASAPGRGPSSPNQPVTVSPSSNAGPITQGGSYKPGLGDVDVNQPVTVGPSQNSGVLVAADVASPTKPDCINTIENNVVDQVYGTGSPTNIYI